MDALGRTNRYEYDAADRLISVSDAAGRTVRLTVDAAGLVTELTPPGQLAHRFAYDALGLLRSNLPPAVDGATNPVTMAYDADRRLTHVVRADGTELSYHRNAVGQITNVAHPTLNLTFRFNGTNGVLTNVTTAAGIGLNLALDGPLPVRIAWSGPVTGAVTHAYNTDLLLATQTVNGAHSVAYSYNQDLLLTNMGGLRIARAPQTGFVVGTALGLVTDEYGYNEFGEITNRITRFDGTPIFAYGGERDRLGRLTAKTETVSGVTTRFEYDSDLSGRLLAVRSNGIAMANYTYDDNGNRLTGPQPGPPATYDAQDRLLTANGVNFAYQPDGELATRSAAGQTNRYSYDALGNLTRVEKADGTVVEYLVDGRHRRVGRKVNAVLTHGWLYAGPLTPIAELDATGAVVSRFVFADQSGAPDYLIRSGRIYRFITDSLGSPRLIVDVDSGAIAQRLDYDEWGRVIADRSPPEPPGPPHLGGFPPAALPPPQRPPDAR